MNQFSHRPHDSSAVPDDFLHPPEDFPPDDTLPGVPPPAIESSLKIEPTLLSNPLPHSEMEPQVSIVVRALSNQVIHAGNDSPPSTLKQIKSSHDAAATPLAGDEVTESEKDTSLSVSDNIVDTPIAPIEAEVARGFTLEDGQLHATGSNTIGIAAALSAAKDTLIPIELLENQESVQPLEPVGQIAMSTTRISLIFAILRIALTPSLHVAISLRQGNCGRVGVNSRADFEFPFEGFQN